QSVPVHSPLALSTWIIFTMSVLSPRLNKAASNVAAVRANARTPFPSAPYSLDTYQAKPYAPREVRICMPNNSHTPRSVTKRCKSSQNDLLCESEFKNEEIGTPAKVSTAWKDICEIVPENF